MCHGAVMQCQDQFLSDQEVAPAKDHNKFISAGTIDRTVLEDVTDHLAGTSDVIIARLMSKRIVDHLQTVHITGNDGKLLRRPFFYGSIDLLLFQEECMLAFHSGQRIRKGDGFRLIPFPVRLLLPPLHGEMIGEHDDQRQSEQTLS